MCQACVEVVQERMDEAANQTPPERVVVHLDDFDGHRHGEDIDHNAVAEAMHTSERDGDCWCCPIIIEPSDTRTAVEVLDDWFSDKGQEDADGRLQ